MNASVARYLADIQQLQEENQLLSKDNATLTIRVEEEIKAKEEALQAKSALSEEKETLSKSNAALSTKVDMANAIKINFIDVKGYELSSKGKMKEKSKKL